MSTTHEHASLLAQPNFLLLNHLRLVEVRNDGLGIGVLFRVRLPGTILLQEFLNTGVTRVDNVATFLDDSIFGFYFFQKMSDFGRKICD